MHAWKRWVSWHQKEALGQISLHYSMEWTAFSWLLHHKIVVDLWNKNWVFKNPFLFFFSILNSFTASTNHKRIPSEWDKKNKMSDTNFQISQHTNELPQLNMGLLLNQKTVHRMETRRLFNKKNVSGTAVRKGQADSVLRYEFLEKVQL